MLVLSPLAKKLREPIPQRWENFCQAYVTHFNASKAAVEAGFSPNAAGVQGSELLRRPQIKERIAQLMAPTRKKQEATRDRVLQELCAIAYSDVRELYDADGRLKPVHELEEHVAASIAEVTEERRIEGRGEGAEEVFTKKVKTWDKMKALEMLAKHLQLYSDAPAIQVNNQVNIGDLRGLSDRERELLRELAESRARAASADAALPGPAEG